MGEFIIIFFALIYIWTIVTIWIPIMCALKKNALFISFILYIIIIFNFSIRIFISNIWILKLIPIFLFISRATRPHWLLRMSIYTSCTFIILSSESRIYLVLLIRTKIKNLLLLLLLLCVNIRVISIKHLFRSSLFAST